MAKAFTFIANNTPQIVVGGGPIAPGTAQHGFGCVRGNRVINVAGNAINIQGGGYYNAHVGATVTSSAAGNVTLSLYQDGTLLAQGSETIAAANDPANISFPAGAKVACGSSLTLVVNATAGDPIVNNVYTTVHRA